MIFPNAMELVAKYQGMDADRAIWNYFRRHWLALFPGLGSRSAFVRQAANLWQYKERLQQQLADQMGAFVNNVHLVDGIPISLCGFSRAPRCRSFRGAATFENCAAKKQTYYGFHGHLLISATGVVGGFSLTPAHGSEREALWSLVPPVHGLLIGDKGISLSHSSTHFKPWASPSKPLCVPIGKTLEAPLG